MRSDDLFDVTRSEGPPAVSGDLFTSEEMDAIRDQYEERARAAEARLEDAEGRADELEFQVKRALASVRDCEEQMRKMRIQLEALLTASEKTQPRIVSPPAKAPVIGGPVHTPPPRNRPSTLPGHAVTSSAPPPAKLGPPPIPSGAKSRGPLPPRDLNGYHKRMVA
jgi:hypothetical protein